LKLLIRLTSSFLPKAAIEVAVCSKYSLEVIVLTFENYRFKPSFVFSIVPGIELLSQKILRYGSNIKISLLLCQIFFVILPTV